MIEEENEEILICDKCKRVYANKYTLQRHIMKKRPCVDTIKINNILINVFGYETLQHIEIESVVNILRKIKTTITDESILPTNDKYIYVYAGLVIIDLYAVSYNVLRIMSGMGGLSYTG